MPEHNTPGHSQARPAHRDLWPSSATRPILGIAGWSGAGKTTLLAAVIPILVGRGVRIALIKHAHHRFDVDYPGKDSHTLRVAGASQVLLTSGRRFALIHERETPRDPVLAEELAHLDQAAADLILVEGFRHERLPKLEVHRPALGKPALFPEDGAIIAVATDKMQALTTTLPLLDLNAPESVARFILRKILERTDW